MTSKKQVLINLGAGNFDEGFRQTTIQVQEIVGNRKDNLIQLDCDFPQSLSIPNFYQAWQTSYDTIIKFSRTRNGFTKKQVTNVSIPSIPECNRNTEALGESLNHWLNPVKKQLEQALDISPEDEIDVVIQTEKISSEITQNILQKLPWHWLNLFAQDNFTDVALSFSNPKGNESIYSEEAPALTRPKRVNILCILGDSSNINVEADRRLLRKIPGAYCVFIRQPTRSEFFELMLRERWDILFFSGHSETDKDADTGLLYLNPEEKLDIQEAKKAIEFNIEEYKGMKLAIFNSCDGLGLARQLANLDIAQIIVWREPVPDEVAQEFLKYFLNYFTGVPDSSDELALTTLENSLYRSVQKARLKVQKYISKNNHLPKVSWLPVIHHNLAKDSISWKQLRGFPETNIPSNKNSTRENLLNRVEKSWIRGVLDKSLHIEETIELGLSERLNAVIYPARIQEENLHQGISKKAANFTLFLLMQRGLYQLALLFLQYYSLPEGTRAIDVFGELENKRTMLILGAPGSGKTTALLEIASESISDAKKDITLAIPVVLNLSSWASERRPKPLADWLVQELNRIYQFSKEQCKTWVINQQLLLLLDGLDEVRKSQREACIRAINQFLREYEKTEIVVCCRIQDYNKVSEKLHFQSAVFYKSPTEKQIDRYLDDAKKELSAVKELKKEDEAIQELVKSPLTLNFIAVAYKNKSREELLQISSFAERRDHLLDTYIQRRFEDEQQSDSNSKTMEASQLKYSETQSRHWLSWLAQRMRQKSQKVLLIEQIQPNWLQTITQGWIYRIGSRFILGLIVGLIAVLHFSTQITDDLRVQISLVIPSVIAGLISALSSLVLYSFLPRIIPRFIPKHISKFIPGIMSGLIYVIIAYPMVYPIVAENLKEVDKWRVILSPLIVDGVIIGGFLSLIDREIGIIDTINKSWSQAKKYSRFGLICGSIYVFIRVFFTDRYDFSNSSYLFDNLFDIFIDLIMATILPGLVGLLGRGKNLEQTIIANQGIWRSAKNACLFFAIFFPVGMVCSLNYAKGQFHEIISIGLAVGLVAGLAGGQGSVLAGLVLIQHFTLRVILWLQGYTPWNYARFLDYAAERIFLRKVGGGYIFVHRMLQEHFAKIPLERDDFQKSN